MKKIIPGYSILPVVTMLVVTVIVYWVTPIWTNRFYHYSMVTEIDKWIPFKPIFVVPYILAYVQWAIGYIGIARTGERYCKQIFLGTIISKLISGILFILVPTTMERAVIEDRGIFSEMVARIYLMDPAINLFPSFHCLDSWICLRSSFNKEYFSRRYIFFMGIATVFVILSTVFIKQHVIADAIGAIVVAEVGLCLGRVLKNGYWC